MPYCPECGTQVDDMDSYCAGCGAAIGRQIEPADPPSDNSGGSTDTIITFWKRIIGISVITALLFYSFIQAGAGAAISMVLTFAIVTIGLFYLYFRIGMESA